MSSLTGAVKQLAIAGGLYRPARWLSRRLRPAQQRAHLELVQLYRSLVPAGALCFDVGANIGEMSEAMLEAGARVVAFEPNPLVLPELRARLDGHPRWSVVEAALGRGAAIATLYARRSHGQSGLVADWADGVVRTFQVPVVTLDAAIRAFGMPVYCKVDVEGWEFEVLEGLSQAPPLLSIEFHLNDKGVARTRACLERLAALGARQVNLTGAEGSALHLEHWLPVQGFRRWYPGDLAETLRGYRYGDLFVRGPTAAA